jgi:hypothetical protein
MVLVTGDGRRIVTRGANGAMEIRDARTRRPLQAIGGRADSVELSATAAIWHGGRAADIADLVALVFGGVGRVLVPGLAVLMVVRFATAPAATRGRG